MSLRIDPDDVVIPGNPVHVIEVAADGAPRADRTDNGSATVPPAAVENPVEGRHGRQSVERPIEQTLKSALGVVAAPPALVTAILYWLGHKRTHAYWQSFGLTPSLLDFSPSQYVLRAADTAFPFLLLLSLGLVAAAAVHRYATRRLERGDLFFGQFFASILLFVSLAYFTPVAMADMFYENLAFLDIWQLTTNHVLAGPVYGLLSVVSAGYGSYLWSDTRRRRRIGIPGNESETTAIHSMSSRVTAQMFVIAGLGLTLLMVFWLTDRLATVTGRERAQEAFDAHLPKVVLYSKDRLHLAGDGLTEEPLEPHDGRYRFRYAGFQFLLFVRDAYILVPEHTRRAVVVRESSDIRLEFWPG